MKERQAVHATLSAVMALLSLMLLPLHTCGHASEHGGVPMGQKNVCDDAETDIEIDWDPRSSEEYSCYGETITPNERKSSVSCENQTKMGIHVCYPATINYTDVPPLSGPHRPNWADYGEYTYVPPQRWLHNLEHGAIVMLYHPCANPTQVNLLRNVLTHCLRKHIITPSKLLTLDTPLALLSWGCKLTMSEVDVTEARDFIQKHAKKDGPEGELSKSGRYVQSLILPARTVSDFNDSLICPAYLQNWQESSPLESQGNTAGVIDSSYPDIGLLGHKPSLSPILLQSQKRRQRLNRQTGLLQRDVRRLVQTFRRLLPQ